jgi:hypothetical protein
VRQVVGGVDQEAGAREQRHRANNLNGGDRREQAPFAARGGAPAATESMDLPRGRCSYRWEHAGDERGGERRGAAKREELPPDRHRVGTRNGVAADALEQRDGRDCDDRSRAATQQREHDAFGDELPEEAPT